MAAVDKKRLKRRTVQEALTNRAWVTDIQGALTFGVISEYLQLWDILVDIMLQPDEEDKHIWKFSPSGQYSANSAYESFFHRIHPF